MCEIKDIVNPNKLLECDRLLLSAEDIIGKTIIENVGKLSKELDELMEVLHDRIKNPDYIFSNNELEKLIVRLPILIYELNNVLISTGVREDLSKIIRQTAYNNSYRIQSGTIADKKAAAELDIKEEQLLETTWKRSVKVITQKIEIAESLLSAFKKIMTKRMEDSAMINNSY